ncbi:reticulon-2b isoform X1 [Misgurnus anguillicaudatus]|uniref:reticulon-2b isoform X1 n=2 Tax=Misgurnus anguillicaudatus TaxID=75329 RepID=UPI003CCF4F53
MASKVLDLLYWRDVMTTALVFTGLVVGLACLFQFSAITILSNLGLGIMAFTLLIRFLYKGLDLVRLGDGSHPFQSYLDEDRTLTDEDTIRVAEQIVLVIATAVTGLKKLFFINNILDSLKFVAFLYLLTYVGIQSNGLTLLMTGVICAFSLPLLYKLQQQRIDKIVNAVKNLVARITEMVDLVVTLVKSQPAPAPAPAPSSSTALRQKQKTK